MAIVTTKGAAIRGIASAVPAKRKTTADLAEVFGANEAEKIALGSGVRTLRAGGPGLCTSDLCCAASEALLKNLGWDRGSIEALVFVSHSPDYPVPATACILQPGWTAENLCRLRHSAGLFRLCIWLVGRLGVDHDRMQTGLASRRRDGNPDGFPPRSNHGPPHRRRRVSHRP
jgi:hypothetical protein